MRRWIPAFFLAISFSSTASADGFLAFLKKTNPRMAAMEREFDRRHPARDRNDDLSPDSAPSFCGTADLVRDPKAKGKFYDTAVSSDGSLYSYNFPKIEYQSLMFERAAAFTMQEPRVVRGESRYKYENDSAGVALNGADLASFFTQMRKAKKELTSLERRLLASLVSNGSLEESDAGYRATKSFSVITACSHDHDEFKKTVPHEHSHAAYYTDRAYREGVHATYDGLPPEDQALVKKVLAGLKYPPMEKDREGFYTEFGAFFRDPRVLIEFYDEELRLTADEKKSLERMGRKLAAVEAKSPAFTACRGGAAAADSAGDDGRR